MWKYLAIQGLLFFLFFQPDLVASRLARVILIMTATLAILMSYFYASMDPFVWILYSMGILMTYWMAQKTLRWVSANQSQMRKELMNIEEKSESMLQEVNLRNREIEGLQKEIASVSNIYDKVKEMSRSMGVLDVFVDLSEAMINRFSIRRSRLLLLKREEDKYVIDYVYQLDDKYRQFNTEDRGVISQDAIYRGEVYPFDLKLMETMQLKPKSYIIWSDSPQSTRDELRVPAGMDDFIALPVQTKTGISAILTLEGVNKKEYELVQILTNRFMYEYQRIQLYADVQRLAITDWLTGAYVRRYFFKRLEEELGRSERFSLTFSFLMIDLDNFKLCNDKYGHLAGDAVLKQTAALIKDAVREVDLVG
ncbi:MAG: hypothetical protein ACI9CF_001668, partial [Candidatus Omnitrophota bacterium]